MRAEPNQRIERYRVSDGPMASPRGVNYGAFWVNFKTARLTVISSGTDREFGWEHVSVRAKNRCPTWNEMNFVKELFWEDEEVVMQFHPAKSQYINHDPFVLHMWRQNDIDHVLPPSITIAPVGRANG